MHGYGTFRIELDESNVNMFRSLKSLKVLGLESLGISNLPDEIFSAFENLEKLNLSHNNIKELKSSVFKRMKLLKYLDLDSCELIEFIEEGFLSNFEQLEELKLGYSGRSESSYINSWIQEFKSECFKGLKSLRSLDLSACGIKAIDH